MIHKPINNRIPKWQEAIPFYNRDRQKVNGPRCFSQKDPRTIERRQYCPPEEGVATHISVERAEAKIDKRERYRALSEDSCVAEEKVPYKRTGRYIDSFSDFGFKKIFSDTYLVVVFLKHLLKRDLEVEQLDHSPSEILGDTKEGRSALLDLCCNDKKGERFILEMQDVKQPCFVDRIILYSKFLLKEAAVKGDWHYCLNKVNIVGIMNFTLDDKGSEERYLREVMHIEKGHDVIICDKLRLFFLEMPKFKKKQDELESGLDKWLYALNNLHRLKERPKVLFEEEFIRLFNMAEFANLTPEEMKQYNASVSAKKDYENGLRYAEFKGKAEERLELAKKFKENGASIELIRKSTGLTREEILQLK